MVGFAAPLPPLPCPECPVNDLCPKVGVRRPRKKVLPVPADAMGKRPSFQPQQGFKLPDG